MPPSFGEGGVETIIARRLNKESNTLYDAREFQSIIVFPRRRIHLSQVTMEVYKFAVIRASEKIYPRTKPPCINENEYECSD
jgi:hypothetical protein